MSRPFAELLAEALARSDEERGELVARLAATLSGGRVPLRAEWLARVKARAAEVDSQAVSTVSWEAVCDRIDRQLGRDAADD